MLRKGQERVARGWGELSKILSTRGLNRKEGSGKKYFKKGVKLGLGVSALKMGAATPLQTLVMCKPFPKEFLF